MMGVIPVAGKVVEAFVQVTAVQKMQECVQRASAAIRDDCNTVMANAAQYVAFTVKNLELAYAKSLDLTIEKVDRIVQERLMHLESVVQDMEARNYPKLQDIVKRGQLIMTIASDTVPFAVRHSYVLSTAPSCVVPSRETIIFFSATGHFPSASMPEGTPLLMLNQRTYRPSGFTLDTLTFPIPSCDLHSVTSNYVTGTLSIPQPPDGSAYRYPILLGILPKTSGTVMIEHTKTLFKDGMSRITRTRQFRLDSTPHGDGRDSEVREVLHAQPGWKVRPGTKGYEAEKLKGKWSFMWEEETDTSIAFRARTTHIRRKSSKNSGQMRFYVFCQEYQEKAIKETVLDKTSIELTWGESRVFPFSAGTWKILFQPFDRSSLQTFDGPTSSHPLLQITTTGDSIKLGCKDVPNIALTSLALAILSPPKGDEKPLIPYVRSRL